MKKNIRKYENVEVLPIGAKTVADFCAEQDYSTPYLYKLIKEKKNKDFKIVVFQGFNFVVDKNYNNDTN